MTTIDGFLSERAKAVKFPTPGTEVTGTILAEPFLEQQRDYRTRQPLSWDDGKPKLQMVVELATKLQDGLNDDGKRCLYIKGQMRPAVGKALRDAGVKHPAVGGRLTVRYVGDGPATNGLNAPKLYDVVYEPPQAGPDAPIGAGELGDREPPLDAEPPY